MVWAAGPGGGPEAAGSAIFASVEILSKRISGQKVIAAPRRQDPPSLRTPPRVSLLISSWEGASPVTQSTIAVDAEAAAAYAPTMLKLGWIALALAMLGLGLL